ncbi:hypothetical protein LOTGIDRAFT_179707 [Lottia gigantea]|uniref:LHFPL tetraspan subfamily member 3 protein n=1 Tax=Lottia gigantea TaxID=225164 RepID=V3ZRT4_LOTGI|nr:hypothetical protein LOTGIDRAFT_179707 [Lottia gigantea]ESO83596.1 hypothetical protein LOTGIDRAFT_179707 [Lottia gigantea]
MDRETEYNTELTKIYHTNYVRNSRAICVLWGIFTVCYAILNIVCFIQPQWIGDTGAGAAGFFGLYRYCLLSNNNEFSCQGDFFDSNKYLNKSFHAAAVLVGLSALLFLICCLCLLLFLFLNTATTLRICAWIQTLAAIFMFLGCVIFPNGWDNDIITGVCGNNNRIYDMGYCGIRWAYILAIVLIFDAAILAILAFVLAAKQAKLLPEVYKKLEKCKYEISL